MNKTTRFTGLSWAWAQLTVLALIFGFDLPFHWTGGFALLAFVVNGLLDVRSIAAYDGNNVKRNTVVRMISLGINCLGLVASAIGMVVSLIYGINTVVWVAAGIVGFGLMLAMIVDLVQYYGDGWWHLNWSFGILALVILTVVFAEAFHWTAILTLVILTVNGVYNVIAVAAHLIKVFTTKGTDDAVPFNGLILVWNGISFVLGLIAGFVAIIGGIVNGILGTNGVAITAMSIVCVCVAGIYATHMALYSLRSRN